MKAALLALAMTASACAVGVQSGTRSTGSIEVEIHVVDERDVGIGAAEITIGVATYTTDARGVATIDVTQPVTAVVSTANTLEQPVVIGTSESTVRVHMWDRVGPNGKARISMHFGGDVMLGRRYLDDERVETPQVVDEASARDVVADLAPLSRTADWTVVNLETVIGDFALEDAEEAKRFLLQSTPHVTSSLDEMGVDLVTLGNNHAYDWGEPGLVNTLDALDAAGVPQVGAGLTREEAVRGKIYDVGGTRVGVLSFTTVNGSFVNDQLPHADAELPTDIMASELWQYDERLFIFGEPGDVVYIKPDLRRIRESWDLFDEMEDDLDPDVAAELWTALREVYPELQDWVARRGHGGAAPYRRSEMEAEIQRLDGEGADMVIVQVHGGYQFAEVKSNFLQGIAHAAINAGADAVIGHHPHVLQGFEEYKGKLIAYSLGNLVFDQDFLSTFPSAMLRLTIEGDEVLEARLLPVMLDRYRPVPVSGKTAQKILRTIANRSVADTTTDRGSDLAVFAAVDARRDPAAFPVSVLTQGNSGVITRQRQSVNTTVNAPTSGSLDLKDCALIRADQLDEGVRLGTDLFDWGTFDDETADGTRARPMHWALPRDEERWTLTAGASGQPFDDALELITDVNKQVTMRIIARVDIEPHRLFDRFGAFVDAPASYEVILDARRTRGEVPLLRIVTFDFDDSNPTADPTSARLQEITLPIEVPDDEEWHRIAIPLPRSLFEEDADGHITNAATMLIDTPPAIRGALAVDNVQFIEWRGASRSSFDNWVEADMIRTLRGGPTDLITTGC